MLVKAALNNNPVSTVAKMYNVITGLKNITSDEIIHFLGEMLKHHKRRHIVIIIDNGLCHRTGNTVRLCCKRKRGNYISSCCIWIT